MGEWVSPSATASRALLCARAHTWHRKVSKQTERTAPAGRDLHASATGPTPASVYVRAMSGIGASLATITIGVPRMNGTSVLPPKPVRHATATPLYQFMFGLALRTASDTTRQ